MYLSFGTCQSQIAILMRLSRRLFAPNLQTDPAVGEEEHGQWKAVLKNEEDVSVLRLLDPIGPHFLADVAVAFLVPRRVLRKDQFRDEQSRQGRQRRHDPHKSNDPLKIHIGGENAVLIISRVMDQQTGLKWHCCCC